ncbi:unnamed protein product, partial [Didymodactylos carnosus]
EDNDTLVFIHIQKTAGSEFERSIVKKLKWNENNAHTCLCPQRNLTTTIKLRCNCKKSLNLQEPWIISRFSVGWICGVHADWTIYHRCLEHILNYLYGAKKRRFLYATLLRDPVSRFISEYLHTRRGANWLPERLPCKKARLLRNQTACWKKQTLEEYAHCSSNSAINRQTRMLSDNSLINCSSSEFTYESLTNLQSAKRNLMAMKFFGLTEYLELDQKLFEQLFSCHFISYLEQEEKTLTSDYIIKYNISEQIIELIKEKNSH